MVGILSEALFNPAPFFAVIAILLFLAMIAYVVMRIFFR